MKRLYHVLALLALVQFFATCGLLGFLFGTKRLTGEKMDKIAGVMRGDQPAPAPASQPATQPAGKRPTPPSELAQGSVEREILALAVERQKRELNDLTRLAQAVQLDMLKRLEEINEREKRFAGEQKKLVQQTQGDGFARELEVLSTIDAKRALDLLMVKKDPDALRLLMEMDAGRVKKIIDNCKTTTQMEWAGRILTQLHNMNNSQSSAEANGASQTRPMGG